MKNYSNDVCQVWGGSYNFFHSSQTKTSFSFYWKSNFKQVSVTHFKTFNKLKRKTQFFHFCLLKNLGSNRTRHWWIGGNFSLGKLFILFHSDIKEILFRRKSNFQQVVKFVLIFLWTVLCYSSRNNVKLNRLYQQTGPGGHGHRDIFSQRVPLVNVSNKVVILCSNVTSC